MKTLSDISAMLELPHSTCRYYARVYKEFLPRRPVEGKRWPMFEDSSVQVIKRISELAQLGLNREQIKDELKKTYAPTYDAGDFIAEQEQSQQLPDEDPSSLTPLQQSRMSVHYAREVAQATLNSLRHYKELIAHKDDEIDHLRSENMALKKELERVTWERDKLKNQSKPGRGSFFRRE